MAINPPDNSYVIDAESPTEMARLIQLDRIITTGMGGPLANVPQQLRDNVLDIACGPGGWVLDVAFDFPYVEVAGIDISRTMIDYANARARTQLLTNASFGVMDITQPLDFSDAAFDLVNARFLIGVLKQEKWAPFMAECGRILKPGGILRLTETQDYGRTNSRAYEDYLALLSEALYRAGYGFAVDGRTFDLTHMLPGLLRAAGFQDIHITAHSLEVSAGTDVWSDFYQNGEVTFQMVTPLLLRTGVADDEKLAALFPHIVRDLRSESFRGMWHYTTVWGVKPV
jgi:ubiquinone/menaquinone biosynthesis C-methylase UbiE